MSSQFRLNPALDESFVDAAAASFRKTGRIHIAEFLQKEDANRLHEWLIASDLWKLVLIQNQKIFELDRVTQARLNKKRRSDVEEAVYKAARAQFQFRYETIRSPDAFGERLKEDNPLSGFAQFLSSGPARLLLRKITSFSDVEFADAQATSYGKGDFLTAHHDHVPGKQRRAAFVFNLTPTWKIDWGGLLMFHSADGHVDEAFTPKFNALNIFAVPQLHSVSMVTPIAPQKRYSVTGWLRAEKQPL
jgi:Rps23 Pro-64 3,4-dihydroxylase Tpa1-like proline 4-hydroxylase